MAEAETCGTCRCWKQLRDGDGYSGDRNYNVSDFGTGLCRRYPPTHARPELLDQFRKQTDHRGKADPYPDALDAAVMAYWPVVDTDDWCAEYRPRLVLVGSDDAA